MTRSTGRLADPDFRRARAAKGGRTRNTPEYHVAKVRELVDQLDDARIDEIVAAAPRLTPDQADRLRRLFAYAGVDEAAVG